MAHTGLLTFEEYISQPQLSEGSTFPKTPNDVNWWGLLSKGREIWRLLQKNNLRIPEALKSLELEFSNSFVKDLESKVESDASAGKLSPATVRHVEDKVVASLQKMSQNPKVKSEFEKIPYLKRKAIKGLGSSTLKSQVDRALRLVAKEIYEVNMIGELTRAYDPNSPVVKKYKQVLLQLSAAIGKSERIATALHDGIINNL